MPRLWSYSLIVPKSEVIITLARSEPIQEEKMKEGKEVYIMENKEEVVKEMNEGELLVSTRTLHGLKGVKDDQRENIFHL